MALSINPKDLVAKQFFAASPDSKSQLLNTLRGSLQKGREQNKTDDQNALFARGAESAFNGEQSASQAAELFAADPQRAQALVQSAGVFTENGRKQLTRKVSEIMAIQNPEQRNMALKGVADTMVAAGDDPSAFSGLIGQDYGQQTSALQAMQMATLSVQERLGQSNSDRSFGEQQRVNNSNIANQQNAISNRNQAAALAEKKNQQSLLPKPAQLTNMGRRLTEAGLIPGTKPFQEEMMKQNLPKSGQTINVGSDNLSLEDQVKLAVATKTAEELAKARGKNVAEYEKLDIDNGVLASQAVPQLERSLNLLKTIKTGGIDAALLRGKQILGVESGNEAELFNNLKQDVLKQLKPIFGSAFTASEGQLLMSIESSTNMSTPGNIRLLQKGIQLAKKKANIGIKAATASGNPRMVEVMQDHLKGIVIPDANNNASSRSGQALLNIDVNDLDKLSIEEINKLLSEDE